MNTKLLILLPSESSTKRIVREDHCTQGEIVEVLESRGVGNLQSIRCERKVLQVGEIFYHAFSDWSEKRDESRKRKCVGETFDGTG